MSLLSFFRPSKKEPAAASAPVARERLQILLSHERALASGDDLIAVLRDAVITAVGKHVNIEPDKVEMKMNCGESVSTLVIDIEIPRDEEIKLAKAG